MCTHCAYLGSHMAPQPVAVVHSHAHVSTLPWTAPWTVHGATHGRIGSPLVAVVSLLRVVARVPRARVGSAGLLGADEPARERLAAACEPLRHRPALEPGSELGVSPDLGRFRRGMMPI